MNRKIVIASGNKGKIFEIKNIFGSNFDIVSQKDIGFDGIVEENGETFLDNALIKAKAVFDYCHEWVLADDSGLCVEALGGLPSVRSARYAGENATDAQNIDKLLCSLDGIENRKAKFVCCMVLYKGAGDFVWSEGEVHGEILHERVGNGGFGYDPIFYCTDLKKSFALLSLDEKNLVSHRGNAVRELELKIRNL